MGRGQELLDAARKGDVRTVTKILTLITKRSGPFTSLRRGAGVNVQDDNGYTPLHHACMNGHREIVHLLLKVDASPCVVDKKGATPLHLAAWKGDSHVVSMLLGHCNPPVNIDQKTNDQETALLIAAQFGHVDVVAQLIAKGADVSLKNNKEESPLDLASQYGKLETVVQLINAHPQLLDPYRFPIGRGRSFPTTPLHRATMNGNKEVVAYLIDAGMDPNVRTENGTALHEGIRYLQASVVKVLLSKGADLKAKDRQGNSVHALLAKYPEDATKKVKKYIREYENQIKISYESEEDLPRIPVNDYPSPVGGYVNAHMKAPETPTNTNFNLSLSQSSSSLTKNPQSFVKKLASKCLGLKAKFNSAPNISNTLALDSDVFAKSPNPDHKSSTNTLLIGNSKFFNKILSKKEESGEINCNDEFDTISLDRLGSLSRDSSVNRSNRSCPGFKTSLPNISENAELSDSESVVITEIDCDSSRRPKKAINLNPKLTIFEPRQRLSSNNETEINNDSADLVNECYEPCKFSETESEKENESNNNLPKPLPRANVAVHSSEDDLIYENVSMLNKRGPPTPAVRNNVPSKMLLDEVHRKALYENISILKEKVQDEAPLDVDDKSKDKFIEPKVEALPISRSSTLSSSSDSMEDETNLEDILLSQKSKSFRRIEKIASYMGKSEISRTQSNASDFSEFTEASAIENVDCSEDIYTAMSGTLPHKSKVDSEKKKKVLFRHKTFTNIEVDRNSANLNSPMPFDHNDFNFMKETLANYHIRGTGHCIHKAPTVEEFIYIFNRETLYTDTPPFTLVPNDKRESYFETAICFCRPKVPKYHKSAEDLLQLPFDNPEENKVTIDIDALRARNEIVATSFRCFCDSGECTLHAKRRESVNDLIVKFSAIKKSISTPDITLDSSFSAVNRSNSMRNPSAKSKTENHYAVTNIEEIVLRNKKIETPNPESPVYMAMSQPSTMSSSVGQYSIKDIADVISINSHSESSDASPVCALNSAHLPLRKSTSSEYSDRWTLASSNSNTTVQSDTSFKTCFEDPEEDSDDGTLHSDEDSSDAETVKSDVSTSKRPWVHSDSFNFGQSGPKIQNYAILEEDSNSEDSLKFESSKIESGISVGGSESSSSGCDDDSGIPGVGGAPGVASLERDAGPVGVRSGSGRRRWDEAEGTSEGDALSVSSAASSCAPHHLAHHHDYSKVSPTPPKKPPRRNLSVSPTHANSPSSGYSYELRTHARSQDDLDEIQGAKHYLKHGRSVDQYVDGKLSYPDFEENHNSPRVAPVPNPRPSLKNRSQPVAITAMYENVVIKEQNPRRKLRRSFGPQDSERMEDRVRKYSNQDRSSLESLLDDQSINSPSDCERYYDGPRVDIPLSPTHYEQPPTPDHPPPSARQAENSIHERIRPLSQLIMEVVEEIRIRKKSQADELGNR